MLSDKGYYNPAHFDFDERFISLELTSGLAECRCRRTLMNDSGLELEAHVEMSLISRNALCFWAILIILSPCNKRYCLESDNWLARCLRSTIYSSGKIRKLQDGTSLSHIWKQNHLLLYVMTKFSQFGFVCHNWQIYYYCKDL